jgi:hypothetical protein
MAKQFDLTGHVFGRLTVLHEAPSRHDRKRRWVCQCQCGNTSEVVTSNLTTGRTKSCGCLKAEVSRKRAKHNAAANGKLTNEYRVWIEMKQRCYNPNCNRYYTHGARGISVCDAWRKSFVQFMEDMGPRPKGLTLERRDNDGDYTPENCYWATRTAQARNRRTTARATINGETKPIKEWCEQLNMPYGTVMARINHCGWSKEQALTTPVGSKPDSGLIGAMQSSSLGSP